MLVSFHPSVTHALAAVKSQSPNVSLSGVIALTLTQTKQCCQWASQTVKVWIYRGWLVLYHCCCCYMAV